jgi:DNA-binding GntR family transcriptional regulator
MSRGALSQPYSGSVTEVTRPFEGRGWAEGLAGRRRVSISDHAYDILREAIVRGQLGPGQPVSEEMLAQRLHVSRTPLRQALLRLEAQSLIGRAPNGRLFVTELSPDQADNLFSVRAALEDLAIVESFARMDETLVTALADRLRGMEASLEAPGGDVAEAGGRFHDAIYEAAGNPINQTMLAQLKVLMDRYRFLSTATGARRQRSAVEEHRELLDAFQRRDLEAARASMREHLARARNSVLEALAAADDG